MRRFLKSRYILASLVMLAVLIFATLAQAGTVSEKPYGVATPYWYGYSAGEKSDYYLDFPTLTGNKTAAYGPYTRCLNLPIDSFIDGSDATRSAGYHTRDNVPALVWGDDEVTPMQITFRLPVDYSTGLAFRVLCSESSSTTNSEIDWQLWVNSDDTAFDAAAYTQGSNALASTATTKNEVITLTPEATTEQYLTAGTWITLDIWNTTTGSGDLEVKGVDAYYTAVQ